MMHPFTLYRNSKPITIISNDQIGPVTRLCSTKREVFLLSQKRLFRGRIPPDEDDLNISFELWKDEVNDIEIWKTQVFIVTTDGKVATKDIDDETDEIWTDIEFQEDVEVEYMKCNGVGQLFVSRSGDLYGTGCCGDVLTTDYPVRLENFRSPVLDVSAGDDFFVVLSVSDTTEEEDECRRFRAGSTKKLKRTDTIEEEFQISDDSGKESSPKREEHYITEILKQGYNLLTTTVYSFGATNNGVLGTGDHIKRPGINFVLGLTATGVCSVSSGREHTIARTVDGRVFHWGVNSKDQIDFSAPRELSLADENETEEKAYVLEACCGDARSIFLNTEDVVDHEILTLTSPNEMKTLPLVLICNQFTLKNHRKLARSYHTFLVALQTALRNCLKNRFSVNILLCAQKNGQSNLRFTQQICHAYVRIIYVLAACLRKVESFYRGDGGFEDITFAVSAAEMLTIFEAYTKYYCDIKSINGYSDIEKLIGLFDVSQRDDFEKIFQQPLTQISNIVKFLEALVKTETEVSNVLSEKLLLWQGFLRQNRIDIELAESTQNFWIKNAKNFQISVFKKKSRRVILDSSDVTLKLSPGTKFSSHAFILFSDCLCQHGSTLQVFHLSTMWVKIDGEKLLKIITPEKTFGLMARSHEDKMLWYDQLKSSIMAILGRPSIKLWDVRITSYVFSDKHLTYSGVQAFGRWKQGVMNGTCYLEYPDGKFYYGDVRNGEIEGYGKMIIPLQGLYEGSFKNGKFNGYGLFEMKDNEIYDGNFRDGLFHGHGVLRTNTYTYVGEFVANSKNGYGILDDVVSGDKYMGMFADNKKTSAGTCITMNGDYFEGIFVNDELSGEGVAVFENGNYYEGELKICGPCGKGCYYLPSCEAEDNGSRDLNEPPMKGNVITGQLRGSWDNVRVVTGTVALNQVFPKFPKTIGELVVNNNRKWRSLFDNFEEELFGSVTLNNPKQAWNRIAIYMTAQKEKEKCKLDESFNNPHSYFAKNITMLSNYSDLSAKLSNSLDKISLKSTLSLNSKSPRGKGDPQTTRKSHSNETLFERCQKFDSEFAKYYEENSFNSIASMPFGWANSSTSSTRSSIDSASTSLEFVPTFGITSLTEEELAAVKEYLGQAFKDANHPLSILNQKISNCFYTSYGCWKVKPTPILSKQAIQEWESISCRVYNVVRKLFPALPVTYCSMEGSGEVVSHISLLYPIVLSEGIYSTLFVLYANKYSAKDELYRQKIQIAEKKTDLELADVLKLDDGLLTVIDNEKFQEAIFTLKQVKEKYCPKAMLEIYEKSMQLITDAHKNCNSASDESVILAADNIMPLTLFLVLRSGVPHLGAELALLDDLSGESNFETEMSGLAGYCYTTITAAYEHITRGELFD